MDSSNETALGQCRFLGEEYFSPLYATFLDAFSDYVFPFALTETQFRNHINLNAVDLSRTVGYFVGGRLVGFSLNGFGQWNGRSTVYDAGTGVVPASRRNGISLAMFDYMLPFFKETGIEQFLLEVIMTNEGAVRLYERLGFQPVRELALLQHDGDIKRSVSPPPGLQIKEVSELDWTMIANFWDGEPSWQNSISALERSSHAKRMVAAFLDGRCVGYAVFSRNFGRVAQLSVDPAMRDRGIGTALLQKIKELTVPGYSLQMINIDKAIPGAMDFFVKRGFYERLAQHEMIKPL